MYDLIRIPAFASKKSFKSFSESDIKNYFEWFIDILPERVDVLKKYAESEDLEFDLNFSRDSLLYLYYWFSSKIQLRQRNKQEILELDNNFKKTPLLSKVLSSEGMTLNENSASICFDMGAYFAKCIQCEFVDLNWIAVRQPKSDVDFGQPILKSANSEFKLNPRRVMESFAYKISEGEYDQNELTDLYDYCANVLQNNE